MNAMFEKVDDRAEGLTQLETIERHPKRKKEEHSFAQRSAGCRPLRTKNNQNCRTYRPLRYMPVPEIWPNRAPEKKNLTRSLP